jgi:glutamate synthase (ferredoxin)
MLDSRLNHELVDMTVLGLHDYTILKLMLEEHIEITKSPLGIRLMYSFDQEKHHFRKVIPYEYRRIHRLAAEQEKNGMSHSEAIAKAFAIISSSDKGEGKE